MKKIECFTTSDGKVHDSFVKALKYSEARYGDALTKIASKLVTLDSKYVAIAEYIDSNMLDFRMLQELKNDMTLTDDDAE